MLNLFQHLFFTTFVMMNKKIIFSAVLLVFIASCDYIAIPKEDYIPIANPADTVKRKVMLEDFTGHTCPNCPPASTEAIALKQIYGEQLVVIGVHAGILSDPNPPNYPANYQTTAGDAYEVFFFITGYPTGMINRKRYPSNGHKIGAYQSWDTHIDSVLSRPVEADIEVSNLLNGNQLTVTAKTKMIVNKTGNYRIVALITEDNIVSPQLNGTIYVPNYTHRHVLRGSIPDGNFWGDPLFNGSVLAGDSIMTTFPPYTLGGTWNVNNLHVVVYIYDNDSGSETYKEILQVEERKLN